MISRMGFNQGGLVSYSNGLNELLFYGKDKHM
jgi:hypothetical protein